MESRDANYLAFFFFFNSSAPRIPAPHARPQVAIKTAGSGEQRSGNWGACASVGTHKSLLLSLPSNSHLWYQNRKVVGWTGDSSLTEVCSP